MNAMPQGSPELCSRQLQRAEQRLSECRRAAPLQNSRLWKDVYVRRFEWHIEWRDYGRQVMVELTRRQREIITATVTTRDDPTPPAVA